MKVTVETAPIRRRIEAALRDLREQQDHALARLTDVLVELTSEHADEAANAARADLEPRLREETRRQVEALQSEATRRLEEAASDAAARLDAVRAEIEQVKSKTASELQAARADAAHSARLRAEAERARDEAARVADKRLHEAETAWQEHLATAQKTIEPGRAGLDALQAKFDQLESDKRSLEEAVATERETDLQSQERLLEGLCALDAAPTLSALLDAVVIHAAREAARAAVLVVRGGHAHGWRTAGFPSAHGQDAGTITIDLGQDALIARAVHGKRSVASSDPPGEPGAGSSVGRTRRRAGRARSAGSRHSTAPPFADLPPDRVGLAVPILVGGEVVAVVYADDVGDESPRVPSAWPEAVEILARHGSRCLEHLTAMTVVRPLMAARPASSRGARAN
jgi:hypothetical protein